MIDEAGRATVTSFLGWANENGVIGDQIALRAWCLYCEYAEYIGAVAIERREFWRQLETHCKKSRPRMAINGVMRRPVVYRFPRRWVA